MIACAIASLLLLAMPAQAAPTFPAGFEDRTLAHVPFATGMAFVPDGRMLIINKIGAVYVYEDGVLHSTPALDLRQQICIEYEHGLSGVTVGPDFLDTGYVYLYYTYDRGTDSCGGDPANLAATPVNRLSRFVLGQDGVIDPTTETVLIDNIATPTGIHDSGDLHFGKDGYLYVSVGDGGCDYTRTSGCGTFNKVARYRYALNGKILRITSDGGVPPDNPFTGPGTTRCNLTGRTTPGTTCREIYAMGLRNPFRLAFDEDAAQTRFFINDVGQTSWEEVDEGQAGADYGWNVREGPCVVDSTTDCGPPPAGLTNPIYSYDHSAGCTSITGGDFVPHGAWPAQYDGTYLYEDFVCGKIFLLTPGSAGSWSATEFASGLEYPVGMAFGPGPAGDELYYLTYDQGLHRVSVTGDANRTPRAVATASPTSGSLPLDVSFDGRDSSDPDDDPLLYQWNFGDGSAVATGSTTTHRYSTAGTYTATLRVTDPSGADDVTSIRIDAGNRAPVPTIESPAASKLFSVGETIGLSGSATDPEDGPLAGAALSWEVVKRHATHTHPFLPATAGSTASITAPFPEDFASTTNSYLEIRLTATDSRGLRSTVSRDLRPALVDLTFDTIPAGLRLELNGRTAPGTLTSWRGWSLELNAPDPQTSSTGQGQTFVSWSDGGAQRHMITTPASTARYTATFTSRYVRPKAASPIRASLVPAYRPCASPNRTHGPPIDEPSCSPPAQVSSYTTVGTPDSNGTAARSAGRADLIVVVGDPSTSASEADVRVKVSLSQVLDRLRGNDYYVGDLQAQFPVEITDRLSGASGSDSATVTGFPVSVDMPCVPDPAIGGSTCAAVTTVNTLIPGAVVENARAIWDVGPVQVFDGGEDGIVSTAGNGLLATQGLFVP